MPTLAHLHARHIRLHTPTHKVKIFHPRKAALRHERWKILKCAHEATRTQRSQRITRGCSHIHMGADAIHVARAHSPPGSHLCAYTYTHARSLVRTRIYTWPSVYKHGRKHVHTRSAQRTHVSKHTWHVWPHTTAAWTSTLAGGRMVESPKCVRFVQIPRGGSPRASCGCPCITRSSPRTYVGDHIVRAWMTTCLTWLRLGSHWT